MSSTFIASSSYTSLDALRYQGVLVLDSHVQLQAMLEKNLTQEHALLFAEPVRGASSTSVDWYTPLPGPFIPLMSLEPQARNAAMQKVRELAAAIEELVKGLQESGPGPKSMRGNILALALQYPGSEYLYMAGGQPVLTAWGFAPAGFLSDWDAQPEPLSLLGTTVAVAVPAAAPSQAAFPEIVPRVAPPAPAMAERKHGLGVFGVLASLVGGLALLACAFLSVGLLLGSPSWVSSGIPKAAGCSPQRAGNLQADSAPADSSTGQVAQMTAEQEKTATLRRQMEELRRQVSARSAECPRSVPAAKAPPPPVPQQEDPPSLAELMPTSPEAPPIEEKKPVRKPKPKPKARPKEPPLSSCGKPVA